MLSSPGVLSAGRPMKPGIGQARAETEGKESHISRDVIHLWTSVASFTKEVNPRLAFS